MDYWYTGINRNIQKATAGKQGEAVIAVDRNVIDGECSATKLNAVPSCKRRFVWYI